MVQEFGFLSLRTLSMTVALYFSHYHRLCSEISDNGNKVVCKYRITKRHKIPLLYESFETPSQCFLLALISACPRSDESLRRETGTSEMFKGTRIPVQKKEEPHRSTKFVSSYRGSTSTLVKKFKKQCWRYRNTKRPTSVYRKPAALSLTLPT